MRARTSVVAPLVLLCAVVALASPAAAAAGQAPTLGFAACPSTQVFVPAAGLECATLDVPFDRAEPTVGDVALAVQRVPSERARGRA